MSEIAERCVGSFECPICGRSEPHSHSAWDVERERYCRPKFEQFFEGNLVTNPAGLDPSGTYGWALFWKDRKRDGSYFCVQVQTGWEIWQTAWLNRGEMFPEMKHTCEYATGKPK